jgi:hypothetical protein
VLPESTNSPQIADSARKSTPHQVAKRVPGKSRPTDQSLVVDHRPASDVKYVSDSIPRAYRTLTSMEPVIGALLGLLLLGDPLTLRH